MAHHSVENGMSGVAAVQRSVNEASNLCIIKTMDGKIFSQTRCLIFMSVNTNYPQEKHITHPEPAATKEDPPHACNAKAANKNDAPWLPWPDIAVKLCIEEVG